jgi:glycosyltransferase involved in cell wall biosynthesis
MSRIAVVTSGFPRRTETFALNELLALDQAGLLAAVFATKAGDGTPPQPGAERLAPLVRVLPPGPPDEQAAALVDELGAQRVTGVHGYFAHLPADVAARAAGRLRVPWGFSVHARDARKVSPTVLGARSARAACVLACNIDVAEDLRRAGGSAEVLPHGVDVARFGSRGGGSNGRLELLSVGRLVEKKGFHVLVEAVSRLHAAFRLRIVGEGPEQQRLERVIMQRRLTHAVELVGPLTHDELPSVYSEADLFVAPSIVDASGDRDGLPNVVLEAMASGLPVVATDTGAIGTVIGTATGALVPAGDPEALVQALDRLCRDPGLRERLGNNARARVERNFDLGHCAQRLVSRIEAVYA